MSETHNFHFDSANDLLNQIAARSSIFQRENNNSVKQFIFRGVGDADNYDLIPGAFRNSFANHFESENGGDWNNLRQICAEWRVLKEFFEMADTNGLPLPEDSQKLRQEIEVFDQKLRRAESDDYNEVEADELATRFPQSDFLTMLALAQHHGLPTRLLDWSRNSFTAAYFAAVSALQVENKNANLAIWALRFGQHEWTSQLTHLPLQIITAPNTRNDNLKAQRGLFTLYRPQKVTGRGAVDRRPFDQIARGIEGATFLQFTLPVTLAAELLYLLSLEGITGATMFPNYDGVVRAIQESRCYPR